MDMKIEDKESLLTRVSEEQRKRLIAEASNTAYSAEHIFQKLNFAIQNKITNDLKPEIVNKYVGELMYYQTVYYEQLLVNLGMEFKLRIYQLYKMNHLDVIKNTIHEFTERCKFLLSIPILDLYYNDIYMADPNDDQRHLMISVIKNFIPELFECISSTVNMLILNETQTSSLNNLNYMYHAYYLPILEGNIYQLIDNVRAMYFGDDRPMSDADDDVLAMLENIGYTIGSPKMDPLISFYTSKTPLPK